MSASTTVGQLSQAVAQAAKSAKFCVVGTLPVLDPGIDIDDLGPVRFPLKRMAVKELIAHFRVAPYGKGTQTLVNTKVRNTLELDAGKFRLREKWNSAIADATRSVAAQLGLPAEQLGAKLYKLLAYEKGGFFLPHRDSEKHDGMVASMIVVLPHPFEGGALIVRHGKLKQTLRFDEAAAGRTPCYAAFYADCEHEVERVTRGVRLCLAYNLVLKRKPATLASAGHPTAPVDMLARSIQSWVASQPARPLVFALEHHYTERGLSLDLLKGADRLLTNQVAAAAERCDCLVHLAQVTRHLSQFADDGSFERSYSPYAREPSRRHALQIGETYEDDLHGAQWTDLAGKKQPWGEIAFDRSAIVAAVPIDDWKPTSEEYEGYTGNAGNTLDRWYHRSALVIWHRDHHFDIVASSGAIESIPLFCSMVKKLSKAPMRRLEQDLGDCIRFARVIIARWPNRTHGHWQSASTDNTLAAEFAEHLLMLHDQETFALFLSRMAEEDRFLPLSSFILAACGELGWNSFAREMKQLLAAHPNMEVPVRDMEWLVAFCCDKTVDPDKSALARELCALAARRFCDLPRQESYFSRHHRRESSISEKSLPLLLKALAVSGSDDQWTQVIRFVQQSPDEVFSMDDCVVPCLKSLIPWSQKQFGSVPPQLSSWLADVRRRLESATARPPAPPANWSRPDDVDCTCQHCAQLKAFLADPSSEVGGIQAREDIRQHLIGMIDRHQCDVKHSLDRKRSPFVLVLSKTTGSYERAVKRFEADRRLLGALPIAE